MKTSELALPRHSCMAWLGAIHSQGPQTPPLPPANETSMGILMTDQSPSASPGCLLPWPCPEWEWCSDREGKKVHGGGGKRGGSGRSCPPPTCLPSFSLRLAGELRQHHFDPRSPGTVFWVLITSLLTLRVTGRWWRTEE